MRHFPTAPVMLVALVIVLAGCAKEPEGDVAQVKLALDNARAADAETYAPEAWAQAQNLKADLDAEMKAQDDTLAVFRSYKQAQKLADSAAEAAQNAEARAEEQRTKVRDEAAVLLTDARARQARLETLMTQAPRGKGTQVDLAMMRSDARQIDVSLDDVESAFNDGDFMTARDRARNLVDRLDSMIADIEAAKEAKRRAATGA